MLSYRERAVEVMRHLVGHDSHGYSQYARWGDGGAEDVALSDGSMVHVATGDRDCSSACIDAWEAAFPGSTTDATYTGNMREGFCASGLFAWHWRGDGYIARPGDVYLNEGAHTAMCTSDVPDLLAEFSISETGGISGAAGDQTGWESHERGFYEYPWDGTLEYVGPEYPEGGADLPWRGVDVYNGDGARGFAAWMTDADFVICKVSEGTWFTDKYAYEFAEQALGAGKLLGFYHFASTGDPVDEADTFVGKCKATGHLGEATLWLDYEGTALSNGPEWCRAFVDRVNRLTGKRCGIYTSQSVTNEQDFSAIAGYVPLWVAQYASDGPVYGWQESPWCTPPFGAWGDSCAIHQYTGLGYVDGYGSALDCDRGYFTREEWAEWAGAESPVPPPEPEPGHTIEVDGYWGAETTAAAQRAYGTPVDGEVWHQWPSTRQPGCTGGWMYDTTGDGSPLILAMQRDLERLGLYEGPLDGLAGPLFWKAFQECMGTPVDGEIWAPSPAVAEFQRRLNADAVG